MPGKARTKIGLERLRSAISNGTHVIAGVDHRTAWMRRLSDLISEHVADLGGVANTSQSERVLVRRCAMLCLQCEMMEKRWAENGGEASPRQLRIYQTTSNSLHRILAGLGLKRRSRDVTPSLSDYLRGDQLEAAE
jgi:hypothetical protein